MNKRQILKKGDLKSLWVGDHCNLSPCTVYIMVFLRVHDSKDSNSKEKKHSHVMA